MCGFKIFPNLSLLSKGTPFRFPNRKLEALLSLCIRYHAMKRISFKFSYFTGLFLFLPLILYSFPACSPTRCLSTLFLSPPCPFIGSGFSVRTAKSTPLPLFSFLWIWNPFPFHFVFTFLHSACLVTVLQKGSHFYQRVSKRI